MNTANEQRLLVTLEARVAKYEKDLAKARGSTNDNFRKIERRTKQSADQMEKTLGGSADAVSGKMKAMLAPFLAGGAVLAMATAFKQISTSV
ncbi:hypothetical protein G3A39_42440, partial [Paraburkholderia aspalathi]|nr:hypothetical protein [Paraburkholderia aspalathi]